MKIFGFEVVVFKQDIKYFKEYISEKNYQDVVETSYKKDTKA